MENAAHRTTTDYRTTDEPCRRCNGDGIYRQSGICFRCGGAGREFEAYERPMTADEVERADAYQAGIAAREAREAARKARRQAKSGA